MKNRKNFINDFATRLRCIRIAYRIEHRRNKETRLRKKAQALEGSAAWDEFYRIQELHVGTDALEIRYARLTKDAENPERLAV